MEGNHASDIQPTNRPQFLVVVPPSDTQSSIDVVAAAVLLWQKFLILLAGGLLLGGVVAVYAVSLPNMYRASAVIGIRTGDGGGAADRLRGQLGGLAALAGIDVGSGGGGERNELFATLSSRSLSEAFIRQNHVVRVLFSNRLNEQGRWKKGAPTIGEAVDHWLDNTLFVAEDRKTSLVTVAIELSDRRLAAKWANAYVDLANRTMRKKQTDEAIQMNAYLRIQAEGNPLEGVREGLYRLMEANVGRIALANVRPDYPYSFVDRAVAPELKRKTRPARTLMVIGAVIAGGFFAGMVVLFRGRKRFIRSAPPRTDPYLD